MYYRLKKPTAQLEQAGRSMLGSQLPKRCWKGGLLYKSRPHLVLPATWWLRTRANGGLSTVMGSIPLYAELVVQVNPDLYTRIFQLVDGSFDWRMTNDV